MTYHVAKCSNKKWCVDVGTGMTYQSEAESEAMRVSRTVSWCSIAMSSQ